MKQTLLIILSIAICASCKKDKSVSSTISTPPITTQDQQALPIKLAGTFEGEIYDANGKPHKETITITYANNITYNVHFKNDVIPCLYTYITDANRMAEYQGVNRSFIGHHARGGTTNHTDSIRHTINIRLDQVGFEIEMYLFQNDLKGNKMYTTEHNNGEAKTVFLKRL